MKALNRRSEHIFHTLLEGMENGHKKIENNMDFMPVVIEQIGECGSNKLFSIAHYYEQNGDLVPDPEMCFMLCTRDGSVYPYYYKDTYSEQSSVLMKNGEVKYVNVRLQADQAYFANMWLWNIKRQQGIKLSAVRSR